MTVVYSTEEKNRYTVLYQHVTLIKCFNARNFTVLSGGSSVHSEKAY